MKKKIRRIIHNIGVNFYFLSFFLFVSVSNSLR